MDRTIDTALQHAPSRDHVALLYRDLRDQFAATVPFVHVGIERGERCLYLAGDEGLDTVRDALRSDGLDVGALSKSGALQIRTAKDVYLSRGRFDRNAMMPLWTDAAKQAVTAGFTALRATGDLSWALSGAPGTEDMLAYERDLERHYRQLPVVVLCRYGRSHFPQETLDEANRIHARVIVDGVLKDSSSYAPPQSGLDWSTEAFAALVTPYVDGELPETMTAEMARRIKADPALQRLYAGELAVKQVLAAHARRRTAPSELANGIRKAVFGRPRTR
jgi:hypothetical protein